MVWKVLGTTHLDSSTLNEDIFMIMSDIWVVCLDVVFGGTRGLVMISIGMIR